VLVRRYYYRKKTSVMATIGGKLSLSCALRTGVQSDIHVVLTCVKESEYLRFAKSRNFCLKHGRVCKVIQGHRLVLENSGLLKRFGYIYTFGAREKLPNDRKVQRSYRKEAVHPNVLVLSIPNVEHFEAAHKLLAWLYHGQLDPEITRRDLIYLVTLSKKYMMDELRTECLQMLGEAPIDQWTAVEVPVLLDIDVLGIIAADSEMNDIPPLQQAARRVVGIVVAAFLDLDTVWRQQHLQAGLLCLPAAVLLRVMRSPQLRTKAEDTVLVTALHWLRCPLGMTADKATRSSVLEAVRLLLLSSKFLGELCFVPEVQELLPREVLSKLLCASAARGHDQGPAYGALLQLDSQRMLHWAAARGAPGPAAVHQWQCVTVDRAALDAALAQVSDTPARWTGAPLHCRGYVFTASVRLYKDAADGQWALAVEVACQTCLQGAELKPSAFSSTVLHDYLAAVTKVHINTHNDSVYDASAACRRTVLKRGQRTAALLDNVLPAGADLVANIEVK
jgi:hypothetical protein